MAITVKHTKVSTIPDGDDSSLIRPSDWNADHSLDGLGTMAEQNANNVNITGGSISGATVSGYIPTTQKGAANGVATLDSGGQIPLSQIPPLGDLNYQGTWNASTNSPTLTSSVGTKGYYYVVSVAGTTNLNGITDWQVGDWAVFNGSVWQKIDNTDAVTSVNGFTGAVVLTTTNIAEGTNEYFTTARARASVSAGTGISYNSTTGVITNSSPSLGGDVVGPASATDNAISRFDTTTGKLIQNSVVTITDAGDMSGVGSLALDGTAPTSPLPGTLWFDSSTDTLNLQQNAITQQIGEELLLYGKASSAINDSPLQIIYQTGVVGASGVIQFAPTVAGITNPNLILGCATEPIALNGFGRITAYGTVHGITTNGSAYGETWADGDVIWYNPTTGNPTNVKPTAPNIKVQLGIITHAGSGGSGSFQVLINTGSTLGGTDSNVNIVSPTAAQILTYDTTDSYWKNTSLASGTGISTSTNANGTLTVNNTGVTSLTASTGISVSGSTGSVTVTNTAPDQTVAISSGTGISVTGTYPNFTVTNTSPSSGGTVTSVSGTAPISVANGTTTPAISITQASGSTNGYLSSTDWTTFNSKGSGTVTSVSVASANGFAGTSSGGATPALTLTTSISGVLKGSSSALAAATAGTDFVAPATATNFTAQQYFGNVALTDGATISWAANTAQVATFTFVSSNRTMGAPSGLVSGAYYGLAVIQNGGSNTLTWNSVFKWAGGSAPTLSTAAGAKDYFVFRSDGTNMYEQGRSLGVA